MPEISVVIPVYNGQKTIKQTIDSVLNQSFLDFELLIINDGSTDSTLEVLSQIQDPRLKIFSFPNGGLSASRNRGISLASGEFIAFIDADDLWMPDKLEAQVKALQDNSQAGLAYSWTDFIDENSEFLFAGDRIFWSGDVAEKMLVCNFLEHGSNPLIRKQAFVEFGVFDESLKAAEDWDMYLRLASRYHFACVPSVQVLYRRSGNSMSTNISKQESASLQVIERAYERVPESLQHLKKETLFTLYLYLTQTALEKPSRRKNAITAARCLWLALKHHPAAIARWKTILKVFLRIITVFILGSKLYRASVATAKRLFATAKRGAKLLTQSGKLTKQRV